MSWNYCMKCISVLPILRTVQYSYICTCRLPDDDVYDYIYTCSTFGAVYGMGRTLAVKFKFWWTMWSQCEEFKAWFYNYTSLHGYISIIKFYKLYMSINCGLYIFKGICSYSWLPSLILYRKKNQPLYSIYTCMSLFVKKKKVNKF